ncbi:MAG TPA: hypothetical protein VHM90_11240 [Phycisphaerae bacterium]|nr:hypothetical protein [Phycisphaerae bacterium]
MISIILLALSLLQTALEAAKQAGAAELVAGLEAAIQKLQEVKDTEVTYGQLESLRVTPKW